MIATPNIPANCIPRGVSYSAGSGESGGTISFGTDCRIFYVELELSAGGRSLRVETLPGQGFPDLRTDSEGKFSLSVDGNPPTTMTVMGGTVHAPGSAMPFADAGLAEFLAPLQYLADALPEGLDARAQALVAQENSFSECVGHDILVGAAAGCAVGAVAGPGGCAAGAVVGGGLGFIFGLVTC
jgi:hypothetical protein